MVNNGSYILQRHILEQLSFMERAIYSELCRMAVFKKPGIHHPEYKILIPRGAWVISYRKFAEEVEMSVTKLRRIIEKLAEKGLVRVLNLGRIKGKDGNQNRTMFVVENYDQLQRIDFPGDEEGADNDQPDNIEPAEVKHPSEHPAERENHSIHAGSDEQENSRRNTDRNKKNNRLKNYKLVSENEYNIELDTETTGTRENSEFKLDVKYLPVNFPRKFGQAVAEVPEYNDLFKIHDIFAIAKKAHKDAQVQMDAVASESFTVLFDEELSIAAFRSTVGMVELKRKNGQEVENFEGYFRATLRRALVSKNVKKYITLHEIRKKEREQYEAKRRAREFRPYNWVQNA